MDSSVSARAPPAMDKSAEATADDLTKLGTNDKSDMNRMGKKQEFHRNFRLFSTIGFTCCVMGTWEIVLTSNTQALTAGGSAGLWWSLCWAYAGQTFVVLSLAEMSSMAPTAGGQYHWVSEFSPPGQQKLLSYLSGWLSTISWQSIVALDCYLVGTIVQALITINDPSYSPHAWQATLLIFLSAFGIAAFNIFFVQHLPLAEGIFVAAHFLALFPVVVVTLVLAPKATPAEVFLTFTDDGTGWPNIAWAVLVGQLSAIFGVLGSDSVAHLSEEVEEAGIIVPQSMVWAYILNVPFTFAVVLAYLFCLKSLPDALNDRTGYPFIYVFRQATGSRAGTTGLTVVILLLLIFITISAMASTSRQTFAFARDRGLPFASWIGAVNHSRHVPLNSILFTMIFTCVISLILIGSVAAFNALLSLSTVALMGTYLLSVSCVLLRRIRGQYLPPARWSLGRWGTTVNIIALLYSLWSFFWCFWPNSYHVTATNFNWACVVFVGLMSLGTVYYFVKARKIYDGPVAIVEGKGRLN